MQEDQPRYYQHEQQPRRRAMDSRPPQLFIAGAPVRPVPQSLVFSIPISNSEVEEEETRQEQTLHTFAWATSSSWFRRYLFSNYRSLADKHRVNHVTLF